MYIDSKVLIPFLPLYVLVIAEAIKYIYEKKVNITLLSVISILVLLITFITKKSHNNFFYVDYLITFAFYVDYLITFALIIILILTNKKRTCLIILTVLTTIIGTLTLSSSPNKLVKYTKYYNSSNINQKELSGKIKSDYNHTALFNNNHDNVNSINENINIYSNYIYSSIGNLSYNKFYYDVFENNITYRNRALVTANQNIMYLMFSNTKYFISEETDIVGYKETDRIGNTVLYQNDDVLPFMYVSYKYMSEKDFNTYLFPYTNEILLNKTIIKGEALDDYETRIKTIDLKDFVIADVSENIVINNKVITSNKNNSMVNIELPNELKDKILFISFDIEPQSCEIGDLSIQINNIKNKLTCSEWKYYNGNTTFNYVLSEAFKDSLNITFSKGTFVISNIKAYYISYDDIKDVNKYVTPAVISNKTSGDNYYASVNAIKDGYFVTSIPYDKGFTIKVDGKKVDIETVNTAFIGFKIAKGLHEIEINYTAPGKRIGILFSIIGIVSFILLCFKRKEKSKH